ncbi:hypothetical protein F2Q70_00034970 [Brassica cretica]|uniref:Uncharacterized protein n=1 Tax=Brassica cretica TaxID=69181 RepID=A0A8S9JWP0_BRACR|nr:hypothetical protein F2Q70_00034970 [Brassica cretica]
MIGNREDNWDSCPKDSQVTEFSTEIQLSRFARSSIPRNEEYRNQPQWEEYRRGRSYDPRGLRYDAHRTLEERRIYRSSYETSSRGYIREAFKERQRSYDSRSSHLRERSHQNREVSSGPPRNVLDNREKNYYSPTQRGRSLTRREEQTGLRENNNSSEGSKRNTERQPHIPTETLNEARDEVREAMLQYSQVADPTESAARRERMRLAEEKMEESALRIATKAFLRETHNDEREITPETERYMEKIPISLRLGPSKEQRRMGETDNAVRDLTPETEQAEERVHAPLRIGPTKRAVEQVGISGKRKPGRPPGTRKVQQSPKQLVDSSSRKRKIQQTKPTPLSSHLWWLSLSPCLPLEIWIMFSFVYAMWAWKVIFALKFSL